MKTKIKVKGIKDNDTEVEINSPLHRIEEIKKEIGDFYYEEISNCKTQVLEMWHDE